MQADNANMGSMIEGIYWWLLDVLVWCFINGWKVVLLMVLGVAVMIFCILYDERYLL